MHVASILVFAAGALALPRPECFSLHADNLASKSACGAHEAIGNCLASLSGYSVEHVAGCFVSAGCSADDALLQARFSLDRCDEWARAGELRRRSRGEPSVARRTAAPDAAQGFSPFPTGAVNLNLLFGRQDDDKKVSGDDCFDIKTKSTTQCDLVTSVDGKQSTLPCKPTQVVESDCKDGMTCTRDKQGVAICMDLQDALSTAGIVISIIFGSALVLGIGSLTFLCCKDRKDQKRILAKAEATALARAATKKKRAADRAPLMRHQEGAPIIQSPISGTPPPMEGSNPFGDQHRP